MDVSSALKPIFVLGPPRSSTTWVAQILASAPNVRYLHEPDNEKVSPLALLLKQRLHRFPYLRAADHAPQFEALWRRALHDPVPVRAVHKLIHRLGSLQAEEVEKNIQRRCNALWTGNSPPARSFLTPWQQFRTTSAYLMAGRFQRLVQRSEGERRLVKSVHSVLALPWITRNFAVSVVIVRRHPLAVAASYLRMGLPDADRNLFSQQSLVDDWFDAAVQRMVRSASDPLQRIGYQLAAVERILESYNDPAYVSVQHETLCQRPLEEFARVFDALGLHWTPAIERAITDSNREGEDYSTLRLRGREIDKWKRELDAEQQRTIADCFRALGFDSGCAANSHD